MADTIYTDDGKMHVIFSDRDKTELVREYAGHELADEFDKAMTKKAYEEARAQTDCDSYEATIEEYRDLLIEACETTQAVSTALYEAQRLGAKFKDEQAKTLQKISENIMANM